jgi:hypothetical protein
MAENVTEWQGSFRAGFGLKASQRNASHRIATQGSESQSNAGCSFIERASRVVLTHSTTETGNQQ